MENYNQQPFSRYTVINTDTNVDTNTASKKFMANVFLWMFAALGISALFAYLFATTPSLLGYLLQTVDNRIVLTPTGWIVLLAPIGFVFLMRWGYQKLSYPVLIFVFALYAAITGISLSFILLAYASSSIIGCFISASAMFAVMAVMGYTTDKDLTSFGSLMMMGFWGVFISLIVNDFLLHSAMLDYVISIVGVMVFTGLIAYHVQNLKRIGAGAEYEGVAADDTKKLAVLGALSLYVSFINLFLMLLRLFGRRRN